MGNRAVITTARGAQIGSQDYELGVYLHWNGGRDSVTAFLAYCKLKGYPAPEHDCYGWARLCQVIGNFFGGSDSLGIDTVARLDCDNGDNGVYVIKDWKIVGRKYAPGLEQDSWGLLDFIKSLDARQPQPEQLHMAPEKVAEELKKLGYLA